MRESIQKNASDRKHLCKCRSGKSHGVRHAGVPVVIEDDRFKIIKTLYFRVPMFSGYKPPANLKAGQIVKLDLYQLYDGPTLQDCLEFIERQKGLLVGTEGLLLSLREKEADLPAERWLLSLDKEETLRKDDHGHTRLPSVFKSSMPMIEPERYNVRLDGPLSSKNCLMVFTYEGSPADLE